MIITIGTFKLKEIGKVYRGLSSPNKEYNKNQPYLIIGISSLDEWIQTLEYFGYETSLYDQEKAKNAYFYKVSID